MSSVTAPPIAVGAPCKSCGAPLASERGATPWCPRCGWNIDFYDPERRKHDLRWTWADRFCFHTAYEQNAAQFVALSGRPVTRPGFNGPRTLLALISLMCLAFDLAVIAVGVWLIAYFGNFVINIFGGVTILVGLLLLPPVNRLGKYAEPRDLADFPALHRLVARIAKEIGAPVPRTLLLSARFNALTGTYGLLRRRFIEIGLPLWLCLDEQERVAMLGHELGHFGNGDVRRAPLTRYAFRFLERLDFLTRPDKGSSRYGRPVGYGVGAHGSAFGEFITRFVFGVINLGVAVALIVVEWIGARGSNQAEYAADTMAARAAGSVAAGRMLDALLLHEVCMTLLRRAARGSDPAAWREVVAEGRRGVTPRLPRLRQLSMREEASLFASHPPSGLRAQLVASREVQPPAVVLSSLDAAVIERELDGAYRSLRTSLTA